MRGCTASPDWLHRGSTTTLTSLPRPPTLPLMKKKICALAVIFATASVVTAQTSEPRTIEDLAREAPWVMIEPMGELKKEDLIFELMLARRGAELLNDPRTGAKITAALVKLKHQCNIAPAPGAPNPGNGLFIACGPEKRGGNTFPDGVSATGEPVWEKSGRNNGIIINKRSLPVSMVYFHEVIHCYQCGLPQSAWNEHDAYCDQLQFMACLRFAAIEAANLRREEIVANLQPGQDLLTVLRGDLTYQRLNEIRGTLDNELRNAQFQKRRAERVAILRGEPR